MRPSSAQLIAALLATAPKGNHQAVWPAQWWNDDIEWDDRWTVDVGVGDCVHEPAAAALRTGAAGFHLKTRPTAAANNDYVLVGQLSTLPAQDYLTLQAYYRLPSKTPSLKVELHLAVYSGGHKYNALFVHITASNKWQYYNSAGALADVAGGAYTWTANAWTPLTLQVRYSTLRWGTVTWPGGSADLSAQGLYDAGADATTGCRIELQAMANAAAPVTLHVDDVQLFHSPTA